MAALLLKRAGFEVVGVDDFSNSSPEVLNRMQRLGGQVWWGCCCPVVAQACVSVCVSVCECVCVTSSDRACVYVNVCVEVGIRPGSVG